MSDLKSHRAIIIKGFLMLLTGVMASAILLWENPGWRVALLLGIAIWGFTRFYYFAFYVIEKYVGIQVRRTGIFPRLYLATVEEQVTQPANLDQSRQGRQMVAGGETAGPNATRGPSPGRGGKSLFSLTTRSDLTLLTPLRGA